MLSFFLNPWMLAAAAAFGVPIIIEIIFRRRRRQIELPTIRYLLKNPEKQKIKRQDQLLLLVRCLVPILLALSVARPAITPDLIGASKQRHVILLIDSTISMGQQAGVSTAFALAKNKAAGLIRVLPKGTLLSLVTLGHQAQIELSRVEDLYAAREHVEALRISHGGAPLVEALPRLKQCMGAGAKDGEVAEVYVFSDFQKTTWLKKGADGADPLRELKEMQASGDLTLVDVGGSRQFNYYATELAPVDPLLAAGTTASFRCTLEAKGTPAAANPVARLTFIVNDEKKGFQEVELKSGQKTVIFPYRFAQAGEYRVEISLEGDNHRLDNRRFYLASVPEAYRVLILDEMSGSSEGKYLQAAIEPLTRPGLDRFSIFAAEVVPPASIVRQNLANYCAVMVLGLERISPDLLNKLEPFVRDGGNVVFFLSGRLNSWEYNEKLYHDGKGLLPVRLEKSEHLEKAQAVSFKPAAEMHPALRFLQADPGLAKGDVLQFMALNTPDAGTRTIGVFSNGKPALLERPFGRGRVILFSMAAGPPENYMPLSPGYPVLIQELLAYLAGNPDRGVNLLTGETFSQEVMAGSQHLLVRKPDNSKVRLAPEKVDGGDLPRISFNQTDQMGVYELDAQGGVVKRPRFVVNLRAEEGDLDRLEEKDLAGLLTGNSTWVRPGVTVEEAVERKYSLWELAGSLLWMLVGLLALESFLATRFGMRRG